MAAWAVVEMGFGGVMMPWAAGSVILGMLALVTQGPQRELGGARKKANAEEDVMSRVIARRHARGEGLIGKPERREREPKVDEP